MSLQFKSLIILCIFCTTATCQISNFSNPVLDIATRDASILKIGKWYYLVLANDAAKELRILKSQFLTDFRHAEEGLVYKMPTGYTLFSPSSLFTYQDELYLYFHMSSPSLTYRMYVVRAHDSSNPLGTWTAPVRLMEPIWNQTSYHGSVLQTNGQLYFVFNGRSTEGTKLVLNIAKMNTPTEVVEPVALLKEPNEDWECYGQCAVEAPSFLYHRDKIYMVYSASSSDVPETSISYMSIQTELDPMNISNWEPSSGPVFQGNDDENVYSTRYPEFTTSPDGTETYMLYTASSNIASINASSRVRIEKLEWSVADGTPNFPVALANGRNQSLPSGEPQKFLNPLRDDNPNDTHVYNDGGTYYMVRTYGSEIWMHKSNQLYNLRNVERVVVYTAPAEYSVSSARIFELGDNVYLYFGVTPKNQPNQLYVLRAENKSDLMQNWVDPTRLLEGVFEAHAYHGAVLQHNDNLYFVWAHVNTSKHLMYIAPMYSPTQVEGPAVLLREPRETWECNSRCINDYPFFLYNNDTAFMIFSGGGMGLADSAVSYMSIETGKNPLDVTSWYSPPAPVFTYNDAENVYGPCHASFTTSPDGSQTWMVYLANNRTTDVRANLKLRLEKISWDKNTGVPVFPKPHGFTHPQAVPSFFEYFSNPVTENSAVSPAITHIGDFYYMLVSSDYGMEILQSGRLADFRNAEVNVVYSVPDGFTMTGSSKMHVVNGHLNIYFSMEENNSTSKIFVLRAHDPSNPMGIWDQVAVPVDTPWEFPAFQSSILEQGANSYLVWVTPHPATGFNSIFIAKMENATHVVEPVNLIRHPVELWECDGGCSSEAPYFIYNEETAYMVHSVGSACKGGNALTYMSIGKALDPLDVVNWNKAPGKVFSENRDENVYCPAHATFTVSPDHKETWMMYHATDSPHPDAIRTARIEKITWDKETTGEPIFPVAHGSYDQQVIPTPK